MIQVSRYLTNEDGSVDVPSDIPLERGTLISVSCDDLMEGYTEGSAIVVKSWQPRKEYSLYLATLDVDWSSFTRSVDE